MNNGSLAGWSGGTALAASEGVPAVEGQHLARAWHNQRLTQTLPVTEGVPVCLRFHAWAAIPPGFEDMKAISDWNSPAHQAARQFRRGINFGNYLEAPPNTWGNLVYTAEDFRSAKAEGFDHVRLPVAWHHYTTAAPEFTLAPSIFIPVDSLLTNALQAGLSVIVDLHHFDEFTSQPDAQTNRFYANWRDSGPSNMAGPCTWVSSAQPSSRMRSPG